MDDKNFVDFGFQTFSRRVTDAALRGDVNASPLIDRLERIHDVARGLKQIFRIARANTVQEIAYGDRDEGDGTQPPLGKNTVEDLLALGEAVSAMVESDIARLSDWADAYAVRGSKE